MDLGFLYFRCFGFFVGFFFLLLLSYKQRHKVPLTMFSGIM